MTNLSLHSENLFEKVLIEPATHADEVCIISGFATPSMAMHHLEATDNIKVNLIVGMTPTQGIYDIHHKNFVDMMSSTMKDRFYCSYMGASEASVHSKIYVWLKTGEPVKAFCGSPNYSINAFKKRQIESITECNPNDALIFYKKLETLSIYCNHQDAESFCTKKANQTMILESSLRKIQKTNDDESVMLPLYSVKESRMHEKSGLNWGQRDGREKNQAYIPIPVEIARGNFFPKKGEHFSVLTEEGFPLVCVVAQDGNKAIETPHNNSILGEYFRKKLDVPLNEKVTLEHLDKFGNRYVKFIRLDNEDYLMEFKSK